MKSERRPVYETAQHRQAQEAFAKDIERHFHVRLNVRPKMDTLDYDVLTITGTPLCMAELKCRHIESVRYKTLELSKAKFDKAVRHCESAGVPFTLWVRYWDADALYWHRSGEEWPVVRLGRTRKQRDSQDVEDVVMIPTDRLLFFTRRSIISSNSRQSKVY